MKRTCNRDRDPAWSRASAASKKRKMMSRASSRILAQAIRRKRAADKRIDRKQLHCATRTVEMLPREAQGDERTKLLFMLACGLIPNHANIKEGNPRVLVDQLSAEVTASARAKTKQVIFELEQQRKLHEQQKLREKRQMFNVFIKMTESPRNKMTDRTPIQRTLTPQKLSGDPGAEFVDLVSSDDEDTPVNRTIIPRPYRPLHHHHLQKQLHNTPPGAIQSSLLKTSTLNNQNGNSKKIFQNYNNERLRSLMDGNKKYKGNGSVKADECVSSAKGCATESKILNSIKSLSGGGSPFSSGSFPTNISSGSPLNGVAVRNDASSSSSHAPKFPLPAEAIITID